MHSTRTRFRRGLIALGVATFAAASLAACAADDSGSAAADELTSVGLQTNWILNSTWAGSYTADEEGYYEEAGLDVDILTGGPNVDFMAALSSGQALAAFAGFTEPATLNQDGGDFVVVGTLYQASPLAFISAAEDGITEPADLEGKRVGVSTTAMSVWEQFSSVAGIDTSTVELVPITTGPEALVAGDIDAYLGFSTEGPALLESLDIEPEWFLLQDYGYGYYVNVYTVRAADLDDDAKREQIKALLKADLEGQLAMIKDPAAAAQLTVDLHGQELGLDYDTELFTAESASQLFYSPTTEEHGIGYMGGDEMTVAMETLNMILGTDMPLDGSGYVDMSLLDEIRAEDPDFGILP